MQNIDINTIGVDDLKQAFQVTQEQAQAIVARRDELGGFKSLDDIKEVPGVGESTFQHMLDTVKTSGATLTGKIGDTLKTTGFGLGKKTD